LLFFFAAEKEQKGRANSYVRRISALHGQIRNSNLEIRNKSQISNGKFQTSILKRRNASFELALPFCSFFAAGKEQKGRARSTAKPMCPSSLCLEFAVWNIAVCFEFRASNFGFSATDSASLYQEY